MKTNFFSSERSRAVLEQSVLTVEEAAQMLRIGRAAAYKAVQLKQIPSIKLGRRIVVPTNALRKLLDEAATEALRSRAEPS